MNMSMVKGTNGKISMMRVCTLIVVLSVMAIFIAHNIVAMIHGTGFVSLGASEALLIAGVLGVKAGQRFAEGKPLGGENNDISTYTPKVPDDVKEN